ncbi:MAG: WecB/TagA/CpsF family glycosyltransferase [Hoeflea sp.]|uniref:WecB/TagA/CpsF family glycosyltransferase n=1 Tax=Hoeflea sp. TaxID=1940281 RepID=UPI0032EADA12
MREQQSDNHRDILGVRVAALGWPEALRKIEQAVTGEGPQRVFNFLNAHNANLAMTNRTYRQGLARCEVLPDGVGVDLASRTLHGTAFPANLNGTDLLPAVFVHIEKPLTVALIGARPEVLERAVANFRAATPWHSFHAVSDGYFDRGDSAKVTQSLEALDPDITLVALGSPVQELWIDDHIRPGHGRVVFGVGALFDFVSGSVARAPQTMRNMRLEWLWRLVLEPSRLWRRYILGNPLFLFNLLKYKVGGAGRNDRVMA